MWWQTKQQPRGNMKTKPTKAARQQVALDERYEALVSEFIDRRSKLPDVDQLPSAFILRELAATGRTIEDMQRSIRERRGSLPRQTTDG